MKAFSMQCSYIFEAWHMKKRDYCFCQLFDLWDTYLTEIQASLMIILTDEKHINDTFGELQWARTVFYFVFKLSFLNM